MNILIVDDHPITVEGYMNALLNEDSIIKKPVFTKAYSCKEAYTNLTKTLKGKKIYDLALIDKGLPSYPEQSLLSGSDLAAFVKKSMPKCKIIMITAHTEVVIIYDIVKKLSPDGLIIKNDITPENLRTVVTEVLQGNVYQSPMVKICVNEIWKKDLMVDDFNRQILLYLSKGFKIKDLEGVINLSNSAIQKRVILMKNAFDVSDDTGLVKEAIKQGFI
jgi:DNA-binding NarL/FixJ family response regulator